MVLCGHDHQEAVHTVEESAPGLVISTAGTISNRLRPGRPSSFNLVEIEESNLRLRSLPGTLFPPPRRHTLRTSLAEEPGWCDVVAGYNPSRRGQPGEGVKRACGAG
jgi:hypothetical protein